jgi:hypothetical protein
MGLPAFSPGPKGRCPKLAELERTYALRWRATLALPFCPKVGGADTITRYDVHVVIRAWSFFSFCRSRVRGVPFRCDTELKAETRELAGSIV